jgi:hypothetical protein
VDRKKTFFKNPEIEHSMINPNVEDQKLHLEKVIAKGLPSSKLDSSFLSQTTAHKHHSMCTPETTWAPKFVTL